LNQVRDGEWGRVDKGSVGARVMPEAGHLTGDETLAGVRPVEVATRTRDHLAKEGPTVRRLAEAASERR